MQEVVRVETVLLFLFSRYPRESFRMSTKLSRKKFGNEVNNVSEWLRAMLLEKVKGLQPGGESSSHESMPCGSSSSVARSTTQQS